MYQLNSVCIIERSQIKNFFSFSLFAIKTYLELLMSSLFYFVSNIIKIHHFHFDFDECLIDGNVYERKRGKI